MHTNAEMNTNTKIGILSIGKILQSYRLLMKLAHVLDLCVCVDVQKTFQV
jgi:hypothetical protein